MKKHTVLGILALTAVALACWSGSASGQDPGDCRNMIGIYTVPSPTFSVDETRYDGTFPGQFTCYLVITNPYNDASRMAPITQLGGYECHLNLPSELMMTNAVLPNGTINFSTYPTFYVSGLIPVNNDEALLAELTLASFGNPTGYIYMEPVPTAPSVPGSLVITDSGANYELVQAYPSSGDFGSPVFGIGMDIPQLGCGSAPPADPIVTVEISGTINGIPSTTITAATNANGTVGFDDQFDVPLPAPPPNGYVSVAFEHADWPLGPRFQADTQDLFDVYHDARTWPLVVETDQAGEVGISFDVLLPTDINLGVFLLDRDTGRTFDLTATLWHGFTTTGGTHRFDLVVGAGPYPEFDPTSRPLLEGWSLIGLPLVPESGANMYDVIREQAPGLSYLFSYAPDSGYGLVAPSTLATQDQGYWFATTEPFDWSYEGTYCAESVIARLGRGWNIVGFPFWFRGPLEGVKVRWGGVDHSWSEAVSSGVLSAALMGYDTATDAYHNTTTFEPWQAYWVASLNTGIELVFDWTDFTGAAKKLPVSARVPTPVAGTWTSSLTLDDGTGAIRTVELGVHPAATDGFDAAYDLPNPPPSPKGGSRLSFVHPEWDVACGKAYASDLRAPGEGEDLQWAGRIDVTQAGTVELGWSTDSWPAGFDLQLYLPDQNRVVVRSLRDRNAVDLEVGTSGLDFELRSPGNISGTDELPALPVNLGVHPNPFNPQAIIGFNMPKRGAAEIRIYTVRGELVTKLAEGVLDAGPQETVWKGVDQAGRKVPSGSYFARLLVDGEQAGRVAKMSLVR